MLVRKSYFSFLGHQYDIITSINQSDAKYSLRGKSMRGSVKKRGSTYSIIFDLGISPETGKRQQKWVGGFKSKKDAERALTEKLQLINTNRYFEPKRISFAGFLDEWVEIYCRPKLAPKTLESYQSIMRLYFKPQLGDIEISRVSPAIIQKYYTSLKIAADLSDTSINYHHRLLNEIFKYAMKWQYIEQNPCDKVDPPRKIRSEMKVWDLDQAREAARVFKDSPVYIHVMMAIYTGLRLGEICGLMWEDIDTKNKICTVRRTAQRVNGRIIFKQPKTIKSNRLVVLTDELVEILRQERKKQLEYKLLMGNSYKADYDGFLSVWEDGRFKEPDYVGKKFQKITSGSDLPVIRFHDLRHTHATMLIGAGVHPKVVSERLGHTTIGITMDLYSHVSVDMQRDAVSKLESMMK